MFWDHDDRGQWTAVGPTARAIAEETHTEALRAYNALLPHALSHYAQALSEGIDCSEGASEQQWSRTRVLSQHEASKGRASKEGAKRSGVCSRAQLADLYSRERFLRLLAVINARDFTMRIHGKRCTFLAPAADFFNHGSESSLTARYDDERDSFVLTASQPIAKGAEMRFSYNGAGLCREAALNRYGFAPADAERCAMRLPRAHKWR